MADPLKLLHEYAVGRRTMREIKQGHERYFAFGDVAYPRDVKTNLIVYGKQNEYYTLESLLLLWENREMQHTAYVKDASGKGIQCVTRPDRRELLAYLKGEREQPPQNVDVLAPIPAPIPLSRLNDQNEPEPKKARYDGEESRLVTSIIDYKCLYVWPCQCLGCYQLKPKKNLLMGSVTEGGKSSTGEGVRDLSDKLTADKIAALKNKRKKNMARNTIKSVDDRQRIQNLLMGSVTEGGKSSTGEGVRDLSDKLTADKIAALKNKRKKNMARNTIKSVDDSFATAMDLDVPEAVTDVIDRELKNKERVWKNRTSVMEAASKDFTPILSILHSLKVREEAAQRQKASAPPPRNAPGERSRVQPIGYSRYDQERFNKDQTAGFKIETGLTFQGDDVTTPRTSLKAISSAGAKPMAADSTTPLTKSSVAAADINGRPQKRQSKTPIIIIPAAGTSLITMYNVRDILQEMRFITTEERKGTCRRENEVLIQRAKNGGITVPYRVVDNALKLNDDEWSRVVAVFVQGPAWQFKGWRWGGNPTDIFANVAAFHLMFDDQRLDSNVAKWSVNILKLSRNKRHLDRAILARFWETLDHHIIKNKPHLRY
uniref:CDC73_C domain-containing protein n=1 Tax=Ascaris lumbricoides TaxID=6252 RepID=A0A0M3HXQ6_ASCLU